MSSREVGLHVKALTYATQLAEVMGQMNPLFNYSHQHMTCTPYAALDQYVQNIAINGGQGMLQSGQRTPSIQFPMGQSPSAHHLGLSENVIGGSPAQGNMQAPGMALQQSQQGTSSSGPSANTSPNVSNKRRRPSVKTEGDESCKSGEWRSAEGQTQSEDWWQEAEGACCVVKIPLTTT